ncbi:metallo-hydrolase/oxidoreductase superfamily protein [Artemisia annua]|uniref:Metallo-hydrolase/oxidoreductase superfamily protein n=1 Tax=Artemisia annua TaxID=35608 RepID=A0A2U1PL43_ARTAN|nr:metallo-hydrolase/oxidoreductase superfamily protein [Artemisia annua]
MATYKLAVILKNRSNNKEFVIVKQTPPPKFNDHEYDSYADSDLWDLPSAKLTSLSPESVSSTQILIQGQDTCLHKLDLTKFDLRSALNEVLGQVGFVSVDEIEWKFLKFVEEPNFGPAYPIETVYVTGGLATNVGTLKDHCQWSCKESCLDLLLQVKPGGDRVGPLVVEGLLKDSQSDSLKLPPTLSCQEYPPGVNIVPMGSRTAKPFLTTNLIIFAPGSDNVKHESSPFVAEGDAMIVDPGCRSEFNKELAEIVAALPRKLIVYVTHHHRDHVDGLSTVQKTNPDACLLVHENTMNRISKDDWSGGCTTVSGTEEICIGGERLRIIFAPGHTDGHLALLHVSTNSLIVGDHCVGQGSAFLDINSGGNMSDYFQSSYKFIDLSPNALISMHGRVNLWPKHMLCGYLKNRRNREETILKAIEAGSNTLFDIVAYTYAEVDRAYWIPAASNVRLHVDHLAHQNKLPTVNFYHFCCYLT